VNDVGLLNPKTRPTQGLKTSIIAVASLSKLGAVASETLGSPSHDPPASDHNSVISTFRPFAAPLSPWCPTPPALIEEGSQALRLSGTIHENISKGCYECFLCRRYIRPVSHVWTCQICSGVLHLSCIEQWLKVELLSENLDNIGWRCCLACSLGRIELPLNYTCWCGKQINPRLLLGLPPHSCGQACSRVGLSPSGKPCCDRPCEFICHAGPCPP
jgi:transcriptional repressor NF-X1